MEPTVLRTDAEARRVQKKKPHKDVDYHTRFPGLFMRHFTSGMLCWWTRPRVAGTGKAQFVKLGEFPLMLFDGAELACAQARSSARRGIDPRAEDEAKKAAREAAAITFGKASEKWITERSAKWRPTTAEKVRYVLLGGRLEPWRERPLAEIDAEDVDDVLDALTANSKQTFLAPLRGLDKWALRKGYIERSFIAGITAPMPEGNAAPLIVFEEEGDPDLSELKAFLACLDALQAAHPLSPWPNLYRLGLLTGARYSEVVGLPWAELDMDKATWTLPAARSKVKIECKRPLSAAAVEILRTIPQKGELAFPGRVNGHSLTKTGREPDMLSTMLASHGFKTGFWYGRLRDTVASWLEFQPDGTERAMAVILNHKPPRDNTRRRHYTQISGYQQARALLERWAGVMAVHHKA